MAVFINNLDEFISPSQECINPFITKDAPKDLGSGAVVSRITLKNDSSRSDYEAPIAPNLIRSKSNISGDKVASVSLSDCLACSGCITSAEAVLIQEQSYDRLLEKLKKGDSMVIMSISTQSRASIAAAVDLSTMETFSKLSSWMKSIGVKYILDASSAGDISLMEAREEFCQRYEAQIQHGQSPSSSDAPGSCVNDFRLKKLVSTNELPSRAISATEVLVLPPPTPSSSNTQTINTQESHLYYETPSIPLFMPMLASTCPGWVCYAEKSHPQTLPLICSGKSAQQITGAVFKALVAPELCHTSPTEVFHVTVMPCFDKKLEASRKDFFHEEQGSGSGSGWQEVDLVLSTSDLWNMLLRLAQDDAERRQSEGVEMGQREGMEVVVGVQPLSVATILSQLPSDPIQGTDMVEALFRSVSADGESLVMAADSEAGSGGLADHICRYAAHRLLGLDLWEEKLHFTQGRNADMSVVQVQDSTGRQSLRFGKAYGFRNIQAVVQSLKRGKCELDFIEVMACPSGCLNGGGQLRITLSGDSGGSGSGSSSSSSETPNESRDRLVKVDALFHSCRPRHPEDNPLTKWLYSAGRLDSPLTEKARALLHTRYHVVPKLEEYAPLAAKW
eukprot:gene12054-25262_t